MGKNEITAYFLLLRLPFQFLLSPIFLWGALVAGGALNAALFAAYVSFHLFGYAGGTALNSYYDRDEGPIGGLEKPPPIPRYILPFSLVWQAIGFLLAVSVNTALAGIYALMFLMSFAYSHPKLRLKGNPIAALATVMLGQGVLAFWGGWAGATGSLDGIAEPIAIAAALSGALIIGGIYPLTQLYQLDSDAGRGDLTTARWLGIDRSFRLSVIMITAGGVGACWVAWSLFSVLEAVLVLGFVLGIVYAVLHWRRRVARQSNLERYRAVMRLYAAVTIPFILWIVLRLALAAVPL